MKMRWLIYVSFAIVLAGIAGYAVFTLSPYPSVLLIRHAFAMDAGRRNEALRKHIPSGVIARTNLRYAGGRNNAFDIFMPDDTDRPRATVIWIHGGGFVAGEKSDVEGYLKIIAATGYNAVAVGYTKAPAAQYPTPVLEANDALRFLIQNAEKLHIDTSRIILAGDSAGAQIAAQLAAAIGSPAYAVDVGVRPALRAEQIKGIVLFCGIYDAAELGGNGAFADFIRTVKWAYFGKQDMTGDARLAEFAVGKHLTSHFPATFVSVGNGDPLASQSLALADALRAQGTDVDQLFFPAGHTPALPHEYQFNLDTSEGTTALARVETFLARVSR